MLKKKKKNVVKWNISRGTVHPGYWASLNLNNVLISCHVIFNFEIILSSLIQLILLFCQVGRLLLSSHLFLFKQQVQ